MYSLDSHTAEIMMRLRRQEIYLEELEHAVVRQGRGARFAGLCCQGGRALVQVGRQIVALGQWLEQRDPARSSA
ncbi:MAG: hypothetical protein GWN58_08000 [Anaerolineae bacterium]|jgi:hypothetical protein|nr:hypothetical protein [Anaerolineae bacterium]